ncbi:carboxypeptidase-like regulatory domain-containing protein [Hyalangium gracile]|uniref:carboxypeptidase-like regulatory domain-containing protein n=1 Tax=Hyalangium gracile TaxID=394092 RepID=UPI001CCD3FC3|nr:carboxypeptidase-like regulatory domain-containing protein [Hyalangium gracile]
MPPEAPAPSRLEGTVRSRGTRMPLADAALFVDGAPEPAALTDAAGRFSLELPPGEHQVEVRAAGHDRHSA